MPEPGTGELIINAAPGIVGDHDIILQSLDSWRPYLKPDGSYEDRYYGSDVFEGTESDWDKVPIIFGKRHPSTPYSIDPEKALTEADGRIGGWLQGTTISNQGSRLLRSKAIFIDPKMEQLSKEGKLAFSSGFISGLKDGRLTGINGRVIPDHVLAFEHTRTNRPQDGAALILNGIGGNMPEDDSIKKVLTDFLAELKTLIVPAKKEPGMPVRPEPKGDIMIANMADIRIAELEKINAEQAELIKNMAETIDGYKKAEEERAKIELENKWNLVKNSIAPGITATPELEAIARTEWETDPTMFLIKNAVAKQPETARDGVEFIKNSSGNSLAEADAEYLKFLNGDE
mgnify:FL=1